MASKTTCIDLRFYKTSTSSPSVADSTGNLLKASVITEFNLLLCRNWVPSVSLCFNSLCVKGIFIIISWLKFVALRESVCFNIPRLEYSTLCFNFGFFGYLFIESCSTNSSGFVSFHAKFEYIFDNMPGPLAKPE